MGKSQPHCDLFYRPVVFCLVLLLCRKKLQSWSDRVNEVHFPRGCIPQEVESGYDVTSCEQIFAKSGRPRDLILYFCFQCGKPFCMYMRQDWRKWKRFLCQTLMISPLGSTKAYLCCTPHPSHLSITSPMHVFEARQYWPFSTESTRANFPMIPTLGCVYHGYDEINSPGLFSWKPVFSLRKRNLKWWAIIWVGCPEKLIKSLFLLSLVLQKFKGNFRHTTLSRPPVFMWRVQCSGSSGVVDEWCSQWSEYNGLCSTSFILSALVSGLGTIMLMLYFFISPENILAVCSFSSCMTWSAF